ncbi:BamA/TamA family outer membrane protein [Mucilaginibacter flavidus]|uniref:BamA/TamA family outer membrane protein n=1 Tax=Mucilaginibacter flavidus TaxID=2949309 RepID=UPI002091FE71|nr:BamA/TamA family outer membrane protein [Mucilaginibacter flavidus]MCO5946014.1 BamA/TamA family outer membrane protein [Mucilaginibacter flavidus]
MKKSFTLILSLLFVFTLSHAQQVKHDSIRIAVEPEYNVASKTHRFLFGENYRALWAAPVKLPIFRLEDEKGGLKILQKGGGLQTMSLRLQDSSGQQWVLRTIQKYPERGLSPRLRATVAKDILQDQVSAAHPFAALTVPPLAQALGIPHSNPKIVYVQDDPALGKYSKDFANKVFLFEEREPLDAEKTDNTEKVQRKLKEDNDNHVDEKTVLRARLLDMLLGDWDRHEDQWRWEKIEEKKGNLYQPVPRDRDQVYYRTSGVFPWIVSHQWLKAKFQGYSDEIRDIDGWNFNARYFDRYFLNQLSEDDWREQITYVQKTLTDSLITAAVKQMPDTIFKLSGPAIITKMKARRDKLMQQALEYYRFISIYVEVPASDKNDNFSINEQKDGDVEVTVKKIKKGGDADKITFHRIFKPDVTKEVRLYGFGGSDVFSVTGDTPSPIKVRMLGGNGVDSFYVDKKLNNRGNLYVYDRSDSTNVLPSSADARLRTSKDTGVNNYDKKSFRYDRFEPIILANYNTDIGILLIGGFSYEKHGFRGEPYSFRQEFLTNYSLSRKSLLFTYVADFKNAIGNNDIRINALSRGPNNVSNFFGIGNGTPFVNQGSKEITYYRNRYDLVTADVGLYHTYGNWRLNAGVGGQFYNSQAGNNTTRFLKDYDAAHPNENVFSTKWSVGVVAGAVYDTRNKGTLTTKGVYWNTTLTSMKAVNGSHNAYSQLQSEFSFYLNPDRDSVLIIANRTGGGTYFGNADYFQQIKLGGPQTLRGYHTWRFTGRTAVYNNLELRLKVLDFTSYLLPGSVGILGFNDIGRVWSATDSSNAWHDGYGGGIYVIPAQLVLIQAAVGFSKEGSLPYISVGFRF